MTNSGRRAAPSQSHVSVKRAAVTRRQRTETTAQDPLQRPATAIMRLQRGAGNRATAELIQRLRAPAEGAPGNAGNALPQRTGRGLQRSASPLGAGRPLGGDLRSGMEARFGHDFSRVRVHSGERSAAAARAYGALAYTTGSDIVFGPGQYRPDTATGRRLLAHELAHVVQQAGAASDVQAKDMSKVGDASERAADAAGHVFGRPETPDRSIALSLRETLRATRAHRSMIQRAVATWAGEFETDKYDTVLDVAKKNAVGVDIVLRFKPGKHVNAKRIGMVQMTTSKESGKSVFPGAGPTIKARSIAAGKDEGAHIDQFEAYANPLYATKAAGPKDRLADTPTDKSWGRHGWRFTDSKGKLHQRDAILRDKPSIELHGPNSSQVFETTAVAVKGVQEGTWYGSVEWGWRSDAANKFSKLPLTLVQKDVPTGTFSAAAGLWAANPTSTGAATLPLPMIMGKYTNAAGAWLLQDPSKYPATRIGKLAKNTRIEVTDQGAAAAFNKPGKTHWWKVTVVDGALVGRVGWVMESLLADAVTP
jgi:Domain of unknown function (DUF4157)